MGLIEDIDAIIDQELPDNNTEAINPINQRAAIKAISARLAQIIPLYLRVNLGGTKTYQNDALKVATNRLMIVSAGTVVSSNPVNDDGDPDPGNWAFPGGATPSSWSHDQATGELWLPVNTNILEITIRPVLS